MINRDVFGKRVVELRNKCGLSQNKLAQMVNVTYQAVSKWENGQALPDIEIIPNLARVLGVSTDYLLCGKNEENFLDIASTIQVFDVNEDNNRILTVLYNALTREDFYMVAQMVENEQLDYQLCVEVISKTNDKAEIHSRKIPMKQLSLEAARGLSDILTKMTIQVLSKKNNTAKSIVPILHCPICKMDLQDKNGGVETNQEWLECNNGHKFPFIDGVADFGAREHKGNNWSNHYRSYEQFEKQINNVKAIFSNCYYSKYIPVIERNIERIKEIKPRYLLEVGCGSGSYASMLMPHIDWPCTLILTDISHRILRYLKRYFDENTFNPMLKIVYLCCDVRSMPIKDTTLDCVTSFGGYENILENYMGAFGESYRVLKIGSHCVYSMSMVDDVNSGLVQKWIKLMEKGGDPDLALLQPMIKSKDEWYEVNKQIGFSACTIEKLVNEYPAPDVNKYPYEYDLDRWMGMGVITSIK